ncbi:MAG: hypothetical protein RJA70_1089, partial [Pseudomonadota bacterium]
MIRLAHQLVNERGVRVLLTSVFLRTYSKADVEHFAAASDPNVTLKPNTAQRDFIVVKHWGGVEMLFENNAGEKFRKRTSSASFRNSFDRIPSGPKIFYRLTDINVPLDPTDPTSIPKRAADPASAGCCGRSTSPLTLPKELHPGPRRISPAGLAGIKSTTLGSRPKPCSLTSLPETSGRPSPKRLSGSGLGGAA